MICAGILGADSPWACLYVSNECDRLLAVCSNWVHEAKHLLLLDKLLELGADPAVADASLL